MEEWKDICLVHGYEQFTNYEISSTGHVRNKKTNRIHKPYHNKETGYLQSWLYQERYRKTFNIHRIIAILFIKNIDNKEFVDHINGDKTDNRVDNIRWVNKSENAMNSKIRSHNTSGYKNIEACYNKQNSLIWRIRITIERKIVTRTFKRDTVEPPKYVIEYRDQMLKDLHKNFACFRI